MTALITKFCSICKQHVSITAPSAKDAETKFRALGHDDRKVSRLRRGLPGYYRSERDLTAEAAAKAAKSVKEDNDG